MNIEERNIFFFFFICSKTKNENKLKIPDYDNTIQSFYIKTFAQEVSQLKKIGMKLSNKFRLYFFLLHYIMSL